MILSFYLIFNKKQIDNKVWIGLKTGPVMAYNMTTAAIATTSTLTGHTSWVKKIARINQNQVASSCADQTIRIWNISTSTLVNTYYAHTDSVSSLAVMPSGVLASGSYDGTVRFWNMQNNIVSTINVVNAVISMLWHPINGYLVVNMINGIGLINSSTLALTLLTTNRNYTDADVLLPSGNLIMAGSYLDVYSLPSGALISSYNLSISLKLVKLLPDNVTAVCGSNQNGSLLLFNTISNTFGSVITAHGNTSAVVMVAVTPDLAYLITVANDNVVIFWIWSTMSLSKVNSFSLAQTVNTAAIMSSVYNESKKSYFRVNSCPPPHNFA
jgi:WD40 repeat protein